MKNTLISTLLLTALVALLATPAVAAMEPGNFAESLALAVERDQPLVIDFYTDW